jgi:hypothetical protein
MGLSLDGDLRGAWRREWVTKLELGRGFNYN